MPHFEVKDRDGNTAKNQTCLRSCFHRHSKVVVSKVCPFAQDFSCNTKYQTRKCAHGVLPMHICVSGVLFYVPTIHASPHFAVRGLGSCVRSLAIQEFWYSPHADMRGQL